MDGVVVVVVLMLGKKRGGGDGGSDGCGVGGDAGKEEIR